MISSRFKNQINQVNLINLRLKKKNMNKKIQTNISTYFPSLAENEKYDTMEDLLNDISDKCQVAIAIFDADNVLQGISLNMCRCKCYYMLLHQYPNQCSMFDQAFVQAALSLDTDQEMLCDYGCRMSLRSYNLQGCSYKIIAFQYNCPDDDLSFNYSDNPAITPLYRGESTLAVDYFWQPNIVSTDKIDALFGFVVRNMTECKI